MHVWMTRIGLALLGLLACGRFSWGKTLIVGQPNTPCPNAQYQTITNAINAAASGDVIEICPALYAEQIVITKPLSLMGIAQQGVDRVLIKPASLTPGSQGFIAVIAVVNTSNVTISNVAVDASNNTVAGCTPGLAGIHFYNASGVVDSVAVSGTQLSNPTSCTVLFPGNGAGIQADDSPVSSFSITVQNSSIHDFSRNGILVVGSGENANINGNSIAGVGPSTGVNQFGIFLADGATGQVTGNYITQGNCGTISIDDCINLRSEGVVLRSVGKGTTVSGNIISNVQSGVFVNGFTENILIENLAVTNNTISNVDVLDGIDIQGTVSSVFTGNLIYHAVVEDFSCGIADASGSNSSGNKIDGNFVNDAYCGVAYVTTDKVNGNTFVNVLFETQNEDDFPNGPPPPVEPGQPGSSPMLRLSVRKPVQ